MTRARPDGWLVPVILDNFVMKLDKAGFFPTKAAPSWVLWESFDEVLANVARGPGPGGQGTLDSRIR